jgi:diguanylate cyclase (GGDEF)-like protein
MNLLPLSSLRYTLLLLVLLAMLPALALILSTAWEQRRQAVVDTQADALRLARVAAGDQERLVEGARSLLVGLAQLPDVQMHNSQSCSALFAQVQRQYPLYANIGAVRPDGEIFCASRARRPGETAANRPAFARALTAREFAVSGYHPDPVTGKPLLTLSYPAVDRAGATWAVVFAQLDLGWMGQLSAKAQLPPGTVMSVTDLDGRVLARHPDPGGWTGKTVPEWIVVQASRRIRGDGTAQGTGLEGQARIFGFSPLSSEGAAEPVYVSVGIPREAALAGADRLLIRNLLWAAFVVVLMLTAATIVSDLLILRRVEAVVRAARRLTAGDLAARAAVGGADEIAVMARTFNSMAERLQARVRDEETIKQGLAERVNELDLLNRMGELFQSCLSLTEAYGVIGRFAPQLFPTESGAVLALGSGGHLIEAVVKWGARPVDAVVFSIEDCWALRDRRPHVVEDSAAGVLCRHLPAPPPPAYLCTPLVAQGNLLGILHVSREADSGAGARGLSQAKLRLAEAVAGQLGLGLANVQLREILRSQSLHDPLTGLFNRRYMAETLEREVHRARRARRPMAVLMLDIDGFKQQNDSFGHDAGDAVLRALSSLLQASLRREDIACRYGGEEFVLVLPDAALLDAARRAEQIREAVKAMTVPHRNLRLGPVTVSIGVAAFPDHGSDASSLLERADAALYEAKRQGRDQVRVAAPSQGPDDPSDAASA